MPGPLGWCSGARRLTGWDPPRTPQSQGERLCLAHVPSLPPGSLTGLICRTPATEGGWGSRGLGPCLQRWALRCDQEATITRKWSRPRRKLQLPAARRGAGAGRARGGRPTCFARSHVSRLPPAPTSGSQCASRRGLRLPACRGPGGGVLPARGETAFPGKSRPGAGDARASRAGGDRRKLLGEAGRGGEGRAARRRRRLWALRGCLCEKGPPLP